MKKSYKIFGIIASVVTILFTSCYDPVFYEVHKDVKPEAATVSGFINAITRYTVGNKEYLVLAADGGLRYKPADNETHGSWKTYGSLPFSLTKYNWETEKMEGAQIWKVLADSTYLYLYTVGYIPTSEGTNDNNCARIWYKEILPTAEGDDWSTTGIWNLIDTIDDQHFPLFYIDTDQYSAFTVFNTNSPIRANRQAYIRFGNANSPVEKYTAVNYYKLNGKSLIPIETPVCIDSIETSNANSAVVYNGKTLFFNSPASITNETYTTPATRIYYGNGSDLYYSTDAAGTTFEKTLNAGIKISCFAVCSDALLIGRGDPNSSTSYGGITKTSLTPEGIPGTSLTNFDTNAEFQLSSAYIITTLINATPEKTEINSALYSSINFIGQGTGANVSFKNRGLWSYYPARGNWNRE